MHGTPNLILLLHIETALLNQTVVGRARERECRIPCIMSFTVRRQCLQQYLGETQTQLETIGGGKLCLSHGPDCNSLLIFIHPLMFFIHSA